MQFSNQKIEWFTEMAECVGTIYLWEYDGNWSLRTSSCPPEDRVYWNEIFRTVDGPTHIGSVIRDATKPVLFSAGVDLTWIAVSSYTSAGRPRYYVLGPVFLSTMSNEELMEAVDNYDFKMSNKTDYMNHLDDLPPIQYPTFLLLGSMLYRCLYHEIIDGTEFQLVSPKNLRVRPEDRIACDLIADTSHGRSDVEDMMLEQIAAGNLNYRSVLPSLQLGQYGDLAPKSTIRQLKDECIIGITLCSRAAMSGGLSRKTALSAADSYIRQVESADTIVEVMEIYPTMYDDYIRRVHDRKKNATYSVPVRNCMDYVDRHLNENIAVKDVAEGLGYTGYYLSSLFHRETGNTLADYIKIRKIEAAKRLLKDSTEPIKVIAEQVGFATPSHFTLVFRKETGMTPKEYRQSGDSLMT